MSLLNRAASKIGIDKEIGYTITARLIQAFGSLFTIYFISFFLSKEEQGYYYTFSSIIAIQIFFELGLNNIIVQFVAHEAANCKFNENSELIGAPEYLSRLSSLLKFCTKVFMILSIILFIILIISGYYFFTKYQVTNNNIEWHRPWILLCFSTSAILIFSPILSFLQGLGKIKEVAKIYFYQQIFSITISLLVLYFRGGLWAIGLSSLTSMLTSFLFLFFSNHRILLLKIWTQLDKWVISYKREIFPYQWKIGLSWICGYFIFQLFNPVLFAKEGAIIAGRMGITLAVLNGISSLSMSWINTKIPIFSNLIAKKNYLELDLIYNKSVKQLLTIAIFLILVFNIFIYFSSVFNNKLLNRFLPIEFILLLSISAVVSLLNFSWATYLRCHKQEPFLINSIILSILYTSSTLILGGKFGLNGIVLGYTIISLFISAPWGYMIYIRNKKKWHENLVF